MTLDARKEAELSPSSLVSKHLSLIRLLQRVSSIAWLPRCVFDWVFMLETLCSVLYFSIHLVLLLRSSIYRSIITRQLISMSVLSSVFRTLITRLCVWSLNRYLACSLTSITAFAMFVRIIIMSTLRSRVTAADCVAFAQNVTAKYTANQKCSKKYRIVILELSKSVQKVYDQDTYNMIAWVTWFIRLMK